MSIRSILRDAFESSSSSSLGELLETNGFSDVASADMGEALLHYAEVAPLAEAEALAPFVTSHHGRRHRLDLGSEELQMSAELPSVEPDAFVESDVEGALTEVESSDDFDIDDEGELDGIESDDIDLDGGFDDLALGDHAGVALAAEGQFGEGLAVTTGDDIASPVESVDSPDDGAAQVWGSSTSDELDALPAGEIVAEEFSTGERQIDAEPDFDSEIDFD